VSNDCYEAKVRYWVNLPRVTHKVMIEGNQVGRVWSDGTIEIDEQTTQAHQHPRTTDAP